MIYGPESFENQVCQGEIAHFPLFLLWHTSFSCGLGHILDYVSTGSFFGTLVDGGYIGENFVNDIKNLSSAEVEVAKRNELHIFAVLPKRWIVEHSFAQNSFQMISLFFYLFAPEKILDKL